MTEYRHPAPGLPDDSWFTEQELATQRERNIHARMWQELAIEDPHSMAMEWWILEGRTIYRDCENATHECAYCHNACVLADRAVAKSAN